MVGETYWTRTPGIKEPKNLRMTLVGLVREGHCYKTIKRLACTVNLLTASARQNSCPLHVCYALSWVLWLLAIHGHQHPLQCPFGKARFVVCMGLAGDSSAGLNHLEASGKCATGPLAVQTKIDIQCWVEHTIERMFSKDWSYWLQWLSNDSNSPFRQNQYRHI